MDKVKLYIRSDFINECLLCKRDMKKAKTIFGTGCLKSIYDLLELEIPKKTKNKEVYLIKNIMKEMNIKKLNSDQKVWLIDRYLAYKNISNLKYGDYEEIKKELEQDMVNIENVSEFSKLKTASKLTLKNTYDMSKREEKFQKVISVADKTHNNSKYINLKILLGIAPVSLAINNKTNPIEASGIKAMQYALWEIVVAGGRIVGFDNSADFLEHSLKNEPKDLLITDGDIVEEIKKDAQFKEKIKQIVGKYNKNTKAFIASGEDTDIHFDNSDLYFAIHSADMIVKGTNVDGKWNLEIELSDTYDYTDFKELEDYYRDTKSVPKSMFSSFIYNLAYFSVKFKVIKEYEIKIKFNIDGYEVN